MLEALLKRVDGLEQRLKEKKTEPGTSSTESKPAIVPDDTSSNEENSSTSAGEAGPKFPKVDTSHGGSGVDESAIYSPTSLRSVDRREDLDVAAKRYMLLT